MCILHVDRGATHGELRHTAISSKARLVYQPSGICTFAQKCHKCMIIWLWVKEGTPKWYIVSGFPFKFWPIATFEFWFRYSEQTFGWCFGVPPAQNGRLSGHQMQTSLWLWCQPHWPDKEPHMIYNHTFGSGSWTFEKRCQRVQADSGNHMWGPYERYINLFCYCPDITFKWLAKVRMKTVEVKRDSKVYQPFEIASRALILFWVPSQ